MANTTTSLQLPADLVTEMFNKVKGHSSLAALCGANPIAFNGVEVMTFAMDGEAELVGEGGEKSPGTAAFEPVTIKPFKLVYQHRVTDEFIKSSDEKRLPYLQAFAEGFSKKIARGIDITAFHGLNPRTGAEAESLAPKCFDTLVTQTETFAAATPDENLDSAVAKIQEADGSITGIAMAPAFAASMAKVRVSENGVLAYPEFRFGGRPASFAGYGVDVNNTVNFGTSEDRAIIGDFQGAFRWGYAANLPLEVIEYGDPDGQGDLKRKNQVVLRAEAYIGFGILDPSSFCRIIAG